MATTLQNSQPATAGQITKLLQLGHDHEKITHLTYGEAGTLIAGGAVGQVHGPQPYAWQKNTDEKRKIKTPPRR